MKEDQERAGAGAVATKRRAGRPREVLGSSPLRFSFQTETTDQCSEDPGVKQLLHLTCREL